MPEHQNAKQNGCVAEHRYIMSLNLKRPLKITEQIHHKDGDKLNNSVDNLEVVSVREHYGIHRSLRPYVSCMMCGKKTKNNKYCSAECSSKSQRRVERPSLEELLELVRKYPFTKIGEMFGVTDNAIRKWLKRAGSGDSNSSSRI